MSVEQQARAVMENSAQLLNRHEFDFVKRMLEIIDGGVYNIGKPQARRMYEIYTKYET